MISQPAPCYPCRASSSYSLRLVVVQNHTRSKKSNSSNNNAGNDSDHSHSYRCSNNDTCGTTQSNSGNCSNRVGVRPRSTPSGQLDRRIAVPTTSTCLDDSGINEQRRAGDDEQNDTKAPKLFLSRAASKARNSMRGIEMPTNSTGKSKRACERSLNDRVTIAVAFGLKKDREDDTFSYTSAKTQFSVSIAGGGGSIASGLGVVRASSDESDDDDLGEASRAIPNPIFGDTSRAVGRQPKIKQ